MVDKATETGKSAWNSTKEAAGKAADAYEHSHPVVKYGIPAALAVGAGAVALKRLIKKNKNN